jgi:hypothetical protein
MTSGTYRLEIDHRDHTGGPLALIAPQAAAAVTRAGALVRVRDDNGHAVRGLLIICAKCVVSTSSNGLEGYDGSVGGWCRG